MSLMDQQWCPTSVQVTVLQARGLRVKGKSGTNDAYAVMQVGKEKYQTSVVEKSVAPVWKEEAAFDLPPTGQGGALHVHVLHRALVGPDKPLGQAVINLLQLSEDSGRNKTEWFKLLDKTGKADKDRGEVLLDIQFMRNNMTASMFDLSAAGKSRSRLSKFKDKVRGKKKESDSVSSVASSFTQVLTDSEEEAHGDGELAAGKDEKKKKHSMKSLFSPKSNLQRNMSQSLSVLPASSSLSSSQSSGLNVEASEGKKKFKFKIHKRSGSSDNKDSSSGLQKHSTAEQSNVCINGNHVYCEEAQSRTSRIGSNFSLTSSGHGSMEDVRERQYSPWTEEEEDTADVENLKENMDEEEEEERIRQQEIEMEKSRQEEKERQRTQVKKEEEEKNKREEERKRREDEERLRREEEREEIAEDKRKLEEQERKRTEEENKQREEQKKMEEKRAQEAEEEEKIRREEEHNISEKRRLEDEERKRREEDEERKEQERRQKEEERAKKEKEERERVLEEERKRIQAEEKAKKEEEQKARLEEERVRKEEERVRREQEEQEEKRRLEEQERRRSEEKRQREERERIIKEEARRQEEEEKAKKEEYDRLAEQKRRQEEQERKEEEERSRKREQEKIRMEEEKRRQGEEEERVRKEYEEIKRLAEEKRKQEEKERLEEEEKSRKREQEKIRMEEEKKGQEEEEERVRKENEEIKRLAEQKRRQEEQERIEEEERSRKREQEKIRMEEEKRRQEEEEERVRKENEEIKRLAEQKRRQERIEEEERVKKMEQEKIRMEEERVRKENEEIKRLAEEKRKQEENIRKIEERIRMEEESTRDTKAQNKEENKSIDGEKSEESVESPAEVASTNPFDDSHNPLQDNHKSSDRPDTDQGRCQSAVASVKIKTISSDEKYLISAQREKRPAPQPPGRNQAERPCQREADVSTRHLAQTNKQSHDRDIKTASVLPVSRSPMENKSDTCNGAASAAGHSKGPAPPRPGSVEEEPSSKPTALPSVGNISPGSSEAKQAHGLNPFEDDEDENESQDDIGTSGDAHSVSWPPKTGSQTKERSSKLARAPPPPAGITTASAGATQARAPESKAQTSVQAQKSPEQETRAVAQNTQEEASVKKNVAPTAPRRLLPVKPLNSLDQPSVSGVQVEKDSKSTGILKIQDKTKADGAVLKGPFSQLTQGELISLVLKQEKQLSERDHKISELEQYIDNLLVRVMEEKPSILMSMSCMRKTV